MKAHHHFSDPEWDGEPIAPEAPGQRVSREKPASLAPEEGDAATADDGNSGKPGKLRIKLGDGKERSLQHMLVTSFWHPDGKPMSSQQFIELLDGQLPEFVKNEAELRALWSAPDTRSRLLQGLEEKGFGGEQLAEMQAIISAEHSDLFDVLAHVADALSRLADFFPASSAISTNQRRQPEPCMGRACSSTASGAIHMASP